MDQIFDRLERLVRAWTNFGASDGTPRSRGSSSYADPDLAAAMEELDDFLDPKKTESERREEEERRARERQRSYRSSAGGAGSQDSPPGAETAAVVQEAYRYLGLAPYAPFPEVKAAYKKLLFKYHPDRNSSSPEGLRKATETSSRINAAYQIIETYEASRKGR